MSRLALSLTCAAALGLTACAQTGQLGTAALATLAGGKSSAVQTLTPIDGRMLTVSMLAKSIKFPMVPVEQDGNVTTWAAQDGAQLALRDGVLISSRGFGMDLMSAAAPTPRDLTSGAGYTRVYAYLDGADVMQRLSYQCSAARAAEANPTPGLQRVQETCTSANGTIRNEFWLNSSGKIMESLQWLSQGAGALGLQN